MSSHPTYRSPIRSLHELGLDISKIDEDNLKLERKRLLLELQFAEDQMIHIGNKSFTKNDVITAFEELNGVTNLDFHFAIQSHPEFLNFLENQQVEKRIKNLHTVLSQVESKRDEFSNFISPYLANAIDKLLAKVVIEKNFIVIDKIEVLFRFLTPGDAIFAFRKFKRFCETLEEEITLAAKKQDILPDDNTFSPRGNTLFLRYRPFYNLTNYVAEYYLGITDTVAKAIITFTIATRNSLGRGDDLVKISDQARALRCSPELDEILRKNREGFEKSAEESSGGMSGKGVLQIVVFVILGLVFFYRSCGSDSNSDSRESDDILRRIEQIKQQRGYTDPSPPKKAIGTKFNLTAFKELHSKVIGRVETNAFEEGGQYPTSEPGVYSRYMKSPPGEKINIRNQTNSDMLVVVWSGPNLNSHFLKRHKSTEITALKNAQLFIYSGKEWQTEERMQIFMGVATFITVSGRFTDSSPAELDLLRKRFVLTNVEEKKFVVSEKDSVFEFNQGNRPVLYSY